MTEARVGAGIFTDQVVEIHPIYWRYLLELERVRTTQIRAAALRLSGTAKRVRDGLLDEPQGELLGQRADGELLQQPEE